jgi:hypothetical protein
MQPETKACCSVKRARAVAAMPKNKKCRSIKRHFLADISFLKPILQIYYPFSL